MGMLHLHESPPLVRKERSCVRGHSRESREQRPVSSSSCLHSTSILAVPRSSGDPVSSAKLRTRTFWTFTCASATRVKAGRKSVPSKSASWHGRVDDDPCLPPPIADGKRVRTYAVSRSGGGSGRSARTFETRFPTEKIPLGSPTFRDSTFGPKTEWNSFGGTRSPVRLKHRTFARLPPVHRSVGTRGLSL